MSENIDSSNYPQIVIPGATLQDVRGLAKGAAQSKGWSIVKSRDDLLVVQRPLDPTSSAMAALGDTKSTAVPVIEATTVFREESGGVLVAVGATLITQPPGSKTPKRTDYTNNYRDALTQSLESLRANWAANRQRIANAIPTHTATMDTSAPNAASSNPLVQEWSQTLAEENAAKKRTPGSAPRTEARAPAKAPPAATAEPLPPVTAPAPVVDGSRSAAALSTAEANDATTTAAARPRPEPVQLTPPPEPPTPAPAPVVDASGEVAPGDNMMALTQGSGTGAWAFYAEQVALVRGCTLTDAGVQLIESRGDGELYKVPCEGADSFLLKCQNGSCQELATANRRPAPAQPSAPVVKTEVKQPQPSPARTEAKPAKPEPKAAKSDVKATKPEPKTAKVDAKATKPEPKAAKSDVKATKPEPKTTKADVKATKPESKTTKADVKATKPEPKTIKADVKATKLEPKTVKVDVKATKPAPKTVKADVKATKPESKTDAKVAKPAPKAEKSDSKSPKSK